MPESKRGAWLSIGAGIISSDLAFVLTTVKIVMKKRFALGILAFAFVSQRRSVQHRLRCMRRRSPRTSGDAISPRATDSPQASVRSLEAQGKVTAYTLPPDLYKGARPSAEFISFLIWSFFLRDFCSLAGIALQARAKYRNWAENVSLNRFLQAFVFTPPLILTIELLGSPTQFTSTSFRGGTGCPSKDGVRSVGLDEGNLHFDRDWRHSRLDSLQCDTPKPAALVALFLVISLPIIVFLSFVEPFVLERYFSSLPRCKRKTPRSSARSSEWSSDRALAFHRSDVLDESE